MIFNTPVRSIEPLTDGRVDCEIEHPVFGWIPFTASPNDPEYHGRVIYGHLVKEKAPVKGP
jgi:hypothetical protein